MTRSAQPIASRLRHAGTIPADGWRDHRLEWAGPVDLRCLADRRLDQTTALGRNRRPQAGSRSRWADSRCMSISTARASITTPRAITISYTASEPDIDAIESGRTKGWQETGYGLAVFALSNPTHCCSMYGQVPVPVCRFYIPPESGDSHFFSASAQECAEVAAKFPSFVKETDAAFFVIAGGQGHGRLSLAVPAGVSTLESAARHESPIHLSGPSATHGNDAKRLAARRVRAHRRRVV